MKLGVLLKETMSGWIKWDDDGSKRPFLIKVRAFTPFWLRFYKPRKLVGVAEFPGWAKPVPIAGTVTITGLRVIYHFSGFIEERGEVAFSGQKVYSLKNLRKTLTTCPLQARCKDQKVGEAELSYRGSLFLFPFQAFRISSSEKAFFPFRKFSRKLALLADLYAPHVWRYYTPENLVSKLEDLIARNPPYSFTMIRLGFFVLNLFTFFRFAKRAVSLDSKQKEALALHLSQLNSLFLITSGVRGCLLAVIYGGDEFLKTVRYQNVISPPRQIEKERWMDLITKPSLDLAKEPLEVDVVVVGSGAGGAPLAYKLAQKGLAVAILEEGAYFFRNEFSGKMHDMFPKVYKNSGFHFAYGNIPIWLPLGHCVGGTTTINSGTCMRTPDRVFEKWEKDLGFDARKNAGYFDEVEEMLDAKPVDPKLLGPVATLIQKGLQQSYPSFAIEPLKHAGSACDGQSFCVFGCPTDAKRSTNVSYIPEALKSNTWLFPCYKAERVLYEGNKIVGILASVEGVREFKLEIRAKKTVIACGAIGSPSLIKKSGLAATAHLGQHLTIHPAANAGALFPGEVRQKFFIPQSCGVHGFEDMFSLEAYTMNAYDVFTSIALSGKQLENVMENFSHYANFAAMLTDKMEGRLVFDHQNRAYPYYRLTPKAVEQIKKVNSIFIELFQNAGAARIFTLIKGFENLETPFSLQKIREAKIKPRHLMFSAHHPLGTCRMGRDASHSVVSPEGKLWGYENLFIADGSVIPGPVGVNPQVTIMANSLRIADEIAKELGV